MNDRFLEDLKESKEKLEQLGLCVKALEEFIKSMTIATENEIKKIEDGDSDV